MAAELSSAATTDKMLHEQKEKANRVQQTSPELLLQGSAPTRMSFDAVHVREAEVITQKTPHCSFRRGWTR